jgi:hypothetical protein
MEGLFQTAYWPCLHYFYYGLRSDRIIIDREEHYQKQSYRNRTTILTANGPLALTIPVIARNNQPVKQVTIAYAEKWQLQHWRAITSAYSNSPYFEFFETEIKVFYEQPYEYLLAFNSAQLKTLFKILKIKKEIAYTEQYHAHVEGINDYRFIHPKVSWKEDKGCREIISRPYYQTFENKFPFQPNMSALDMIFNVGLETRVLLS